VSAVLPVSRLILAGTKAASVPALPPVQNLGGWNDPPVSAFASAGPARQIRS
jgi:hypothetical protein